MLKTSMTRKPRSRLAAAIHEMASDLYEGGLIDARRMREYNERYLKPVQPFSPQKIQTLRRKHHISQSVLASLINTSVSTVQKWEVGDKKPSGPSLKLLDLIERKGIDVVL